MSGTPRSSALTPSASVKGGSVGPSTRGRASQGNIGSRSTARLDSSARASDTRGSGLAGTSGTRLGRGMGKASPADADLNPSHPKATPLFELNANDNKSTSSRHHGSENRESLRSANASPFRSALKANGPSIHRTRDPRRRRAVSSTAGSRNSEGETENSEVPQDYNTRYEQLKSDRAKRRAKAIEEGQMADPNQPTSLNRAITPVGTCTEMCPEFERVERIVQKMIDKCEKLLDPESGEYQIVDAKMIKRFRRSAAGYDEQLPSDIRTPKTLLQTMNYLLRHVIGDDESLGVIHKFIWDRTRSIRNDLSIQQLTQEHDVEIAVKCLERIARFHIVSLHILSNPANTEPFDHHQEREQLNNTLLSLLYYYDDNRGRMVFPNEDEFRAYYIVFSIHDQRPDLEARIQKWPRELRQSPRIQVAMELFAGAGNTWEYQGTLDAKRPNAIAQGFYSRFMNIVQSDSVSYLMACIAEIYFNQVRQTAIRSIWKAYCRQPVSQQSKNQEWSLDELTVAMAFDNEEQTIAFCEEQGLEFATNSDGQLYLSWGDRSLDSVAFRPSSQQTFSERYVESKRCGRTLVALILGMNVAQAARHGMIDESLLPKDSLSQETSIKSDGEDESLFVSEDEGQFQMDVSRTQASDSERGDNVLAGSSEFPPSWNNLQVDPLNTQSEQIFNETKNLATSPLHQALKIQATTPTVIQQQHRPSATAPAFNFLQARAISEGTSTMTTSRIQQPAGSVTAVSSTKPSTAVPGSVNSTPSPFSAAKSSSPSTQPTFSTTFGSTFGSIFSSSLGLQSMSQPVQPTSSAQGQTLFKPSDRPQSILFAQPAPVSRSATSPTRSWLQGEPSITPLAGADNTKGTQPSGGPFSLFRPEAKPTPQIQGLAATKPQEWSFNPFAAATGSDKPTILPQGNTSLFSRVSAPSGLQGSTATPFSVQNGLFAQRSAISVSMGDEKITEVIQNPGFPSNKAAPKEVSVDLTQKPSEKSQMATFHRPASSALLSAPAMTNKLPDVEVSTFPALESRMPKFEWPNSSDRAMEEPEGHTAQEAAQVESVEREAIEREVAEREAKRRETARREAAEREAIQREVERRQAAEREAAQREIARREAKEREIALRELATKEAIEREIVEWAKRKPTDQEGEGESSKGLHKAARLARTETPAVDELLDIEQREQVMPPPAAPSPPAEPLINEDDLLLSAARMAANELAYGKHLWTDISEFRQSTSPSSTPRSGHVHGTSDRTAKDGSHIFVNGYDVALGPSTPIGLGRTLSRTEQRIRLTGAKGLAFKPIAPVGNPSNGKARRPERVKPGRLKFSESSDSSGYIS